MDKAILGLPVPDARPYDTVYRALTDAIKRNASLENQLLSDLGFKLYSYLGKRLYTL